MANASLIAVSNRWTWPGLVSAKALHYQFVCFSNPADWTAASLVSATGLAAYRQGRFPRAIEYSEEALRRLAGPPSPAVLPVSWLRAETYAVLAMARWKMQETVSAHMGLKKCQEIVRTEMPVLNSGDLGEDWPDWIISQALLREATGLIEGQTGGNVVQSRRPEVQNRAEQPSGSQPQDGNTQRKPE